MISRLILVYFILNNNNEIKNNINNQVFIIVYKGKQGVYSLIISESSVIFQYSEHGSVY